MEPEIKFLTGLDAIKLRPQMYIPRYKTEGFPVLIGMVIASLQDVSPHDLSIRTEIDTKNKFFEFETDNFMVRGPCPWNPDISIVQSILENITLGISDLCVVNAFSKRLIWEDSEWILIYENGLLVHKESSVIRRHESGFVRLLVFPIDEINFPRQA